MQKKIKKNKVTKKQTANFRIVRIFMGVFSLLILLLVGLSLLSHTSGTDVLGATTTTHCIPCSTYWCRLMSYVSTRTTCLPTPFPTPFLSPTPRLTPWPTPSQRCYYKPQCPVCKTKFCPQYTCRVILVCPSGTPAPTPAPTPTVAVTPAPTPTWVPFPAAR